MFLKVNQDGYILGHMAQVTVGYDIEIADQYLITFIEKEWAYKFKYIEGALVELTPEEMLAQPQYLAHIREKAIQQGINNIEFGKRVIAMIGALLNVKNLSNEQTAQINSSFAVIITLLSTGSLNTAKDAINAVQVNEIITEEDKTAVLAELNSYLGL